VIRTCTFVLLCLINEPWKKLFIEPFRPSIRTPPTATPLFSKTTQEHIQLRDRAASLSAPAARNGEPLINATAPSLARIYVALAAEARA
jgi:hypothetical protein